MSGEAKAEDARAALERFLLDNPDLERLESIASDFNPFVSMGWTRQEIRHSAFLRWVLDPSESHGLGTYPLRSFMKSVVVRAGAGEEIPSLFDVDGWDLSGTTVLTEWECIDVLVQNDVDGFVIVVENKVDTKEHSDQLARYAGRIDSRFPSHKKCFVYLTPGGDPPSDERYTAISYRDVVELLELVCERRGGQTSEEVVAFIKSYSEMIRRHIVEDSEVQELCRRIYANHRHALDLIFEHRPDRQLQISEIIKKLVTDAGAILDQCSKAYVRWVTPVLNRCPAVGSGWTRTGRMLLFEIDSAGDKVAMKLILGPGPQELRERVHAAVQDMAVLNRRENKFYPKWWTFHGMTLLSKKQYESIELEEAESQLRERLGRFFVDDLPAIDAALGPLVDQLQRDFG